MTHTGIECFLAICHYKTGSAAAQALYITQPSLSARLQALEREVGVSLFYRRKGSREMILTQAGREFYQLAEQYEELMEKMKKLGNKNHTLRVACFNSLGTYLFPGVYKLFLQKNPQNSLQLQDMTISASSQSILRGETDVAFSTGRIFIDHLRQFPVFSEPMVLICPQKSKLQSPVKLSELPPREEVFVEWCKEFSRWHQTVFPESAPQLRVAIMRQLRQFLEQEKRWAIVPVSVAKGLSEECNIRQLETDMPLPNREVLCVISSQRHVPALESFLECLHQELSTYPEFTIFHEGEPLFNLAD